MLARVKARVVLLLSVSLGLLLSSDESIIVDIGRFLDAPAADGSETSTAGAGTGVGGGGSE